MAEDHMPVGVGKSKEADELDDMVRFDAPDEDERDVDENDEGADDAESRVITISWWFPLVAILVLGLGFALGRTLRPPVEAPPPVVEVPADLQNVDPSTGIPQAPGQQAEAYHPLRGQPAPDFSMALLATGKPVKLSDYRGKPVLINFWATWCPPCRYEMPWLQSTYAAYKDKGFELVGVDAGERVVPESAGDVVKNFVAEMGLTFPILMGPESERVQYDYSVFALPSSFFVDKDGTVVDAHTGMFTSQADLEQRVARLVAMK